jgi:hypothetical protein
MAMGLALAVIAFRLLGTGTALAEGPAPEAAPVSMTFEQPAPSADGNGLSLSVRLARADGGAVARQPVEFFVTPDFIGERPVAIKTALTNADGMATVTYTPTWEGEHRITARYNGDGTFQPAEVTSALQLTGLSLAEIPADEHLNPLRQLATPGAVSVVLAVWLTLAAVFVRVGWGVWRTGQRGEADISPPPDAKGVPETTFGR